MKRIVFTLFALIVVIGLLVLAAPVFAVPRLLGVPDITVETQVGVLPHLPYYIPGTYSSTVPGPLVRVNWPAPTDNSQVLTIGTYTVTGTVPGTSFTPKATVIVEAAGSPVVMPVAVEAFPLGNVLLNQQSNGKDSQFILNRNKFFNGLLNLAKPDSFLYMFRNAFGQPQPVGAVALGGWDTQTTKLRGHATGHYLSALAQAYASSAYDVNLQAQFQQKLDYLVDNLYTLSQMSGKPAYNGGPTNADPATIPYGPGKSSYNSDLTTTGIRTDYWNWGEGFLSAYPPDQFIMLENGATYGSGNSNVWAPYYTMHKIIAGLLDAYTLEGNEKALTIAKGMGLWVYQRLSRVPQATLIRMWSTYIAGEYGGMNEVLAKLYQYTGDQRYLAAAKMFDNMNVFYGGTAQSGGLAQNVDNFRGLHANQHIPQMTGALREYDACGERKYYDVAANFWDMVINSYGYSIGGTAGARNPNNSENFTAQPNTLYSNGFNTSGQNETCGTYNLLKLTRQLFMHDQNPKYMDYYERALYNDILASVAQNDAGNTYHIPIDHIGQSKSFGNANMNGFSCCNGTGLESNTKLQDSIYFKNTDNTTLYVNLYIPSTVTWNERNVIVTQATNYPYADNTTLTINGGGRFDIKVRVPAWATNGFYVKINGVDQGVQATPGTYLTLSRTWVDGDTIYLKMPFHFYLSRVMDQPNIATIFDGPVLLAFQESSVNTSNWRAMTLQAADAFGQSLSGITGDPGSLTFTSNGLTLKPFYLSYGRYSVYTNVALNLTNNPPVAATLPKYAVDEGKLLSFKLKASDPDFDIISYSASNLPAGASFDPASGSFNWVPDYTQAGTYALQLMVSDGTVSVPVTANIVVNNVNRPPVIATLANFVDTTGEALSFKVNACDPDGDSLTYSAADLPAGANFDPVTRTFNWPQTITGSYTVLFTVSDEQISVTAPAVITVYPGSNRPPVMSVIPSYTVKVGKLISFTVKATDSDGDILTYSADNLPSGASFLPGTGKFSWAPTTVGTYKVQFTVYDGQLSDRKTATIIVQ